MEENRNDLQPAAPETERNELLEKRVFTDISSGPVPEENSAPAQTELPEPDFFKPVVLDESFAARTPVPAAPKTQPVPSARRDFGVTRTPKKKKRLAPRQPIWTVRLCSGELPSDALRRIVREFGALLLFCLIVVGSLWARNFISDKLTDNTYDTLVKSTVYSDPVSCRGFTVEPTELQDGYVLAQAVCTKVGTPITDSSVFEKNAGDAVFPAEVAACMESALPADRVLLKENISNMDLLVQIHESLRENKPVIVLISAENAPEFTLQYAAVTRMDAENDRIVVENPHVGTQEFTFEAFIAATRFENFEEMPYQMKLALTVGTWSPNTAIFVD